MFFDSLVNLTEPILQEIDAENEGSEVPYSAYGRYYLRTADEDREVSPAELKNSLSQMNIKKNGKRLNQKF